MSYYNEIAPYAAAWLRNLSAAGHIASGTVDERSIRDVTPANLTPSAQAHFFAGLGGWSYALRLAGWPDDVPVWTGSCPCQPFSAAGRRKGFQDDRHLWPEWFRLIRECRPSVIFGEQVASPDGLRWLELVSSDLEGAGYTFGAADLCAASIGAPHIRQRLYFVAVADRERLDGIRLRLLERGSHPTSLETSRRGASGALADDDDEGSEGCGRGLGDCGGMGNSSSSRGGRDTGAILGSQGEGGSGGGLTRGVTDKPVNASPGFWSACDWVACTDGKARPVEPGSFPLAHGVSGRVGRLRAYGNAIVPQVAATFISAAMDWIAPAP